MTRDDRGRIEPRDDGAARDAASRPLDLSTLRDDTAAVLAGDRWEALARRIEAAAGPELTRRAARARRLGGPPDVLAAIARAARPALVALAASAVLAVALARADGAAPASESSLEVAEVSVAQALRVDEPAASWILQQRAPNAQDIARALDPEAAQ